MQGTLVLRHTPKSLGGGGGVVGSCAVPSTKLKCVHCVTIVLYNTSHRQWLDVVVFCIFFVKPEYFVKAYRHCTPLPHYPIVCSIYHSAMHHRRAASDTAMFKRLTPADAKKEGSSSSQGSRSATPLVSSMLKPAGTYIAATLSTN